MSTFLKFSSNASSCCLTRSLAEEPSGSVVRGREQEALGGLRALGGAELADALERGLGAARLRVLALDLVGLVDDRRVLAARRALDERQVDGLGRVRRLRRRVSSAIASPLLMPFWSVYLPGRRLPRLPSTVALSSKKRAESTTPCLGEDGADLAGVGVLGDRDGDVALRVPVERLEGRVGDVQQAEEDHERDHGEDPAAPVAVARARADVRGGGVLRRTAGRVGRGALARRARRRHGRGARRRGAQRLGGRRLDAPLRRTRRARRWPREAGGVRVDRGGGRAGCRAAATISAPRRAGRRAAASCSSVWNGVNSTVGWWSARSAGRRGARPPSRRRVESRAPRAGCSGAASGAACLVRAASSTRASSRGGSARRLLARRGSTRGASSRGASTRDSSRGASTRGSRRPAAPLRAAPRRGALLARGGSTGGSSSPRGRRRGDSRRLLARRLDPRRLGSKTAAARLLDRLRLTLHRGARGLDVRRADGVLEGLRRQGRPARRAARSAAARARSSGLRVSERLPNNVRKR